MCDHAVLPPPATPTHPASRWEWTYPGTKDQAAKVRASLRSFLNGSPLADDAVTLVSELAANAVSHSRSRLPGGQFTVRAELYHDGCLHAEVEDQGSSRWDGDLRAAECPHGLYLLRALSTCCGTRPGQHGWITWFTLAAPTARQTPRP